MNCRIGSTAPPIERLFCYARVLRAGGHFTRREMCARFEICRKTVVRDIAFMRDRLDYEIAYDATTDRWSLKSAPTPIL